MKTIDPKNLDLLNDVTRKSVFREVSRNILLTDRDNRKYGVSQDTGGSIARALDKAYKLGLRHAAQGVNQNKANDEIVNESVSWLQLPARARNAFDNIVRFKWAVTIRPNSDCFASSKYVWSCFRFGSNDQVDFAQHYSLATLLPLKKSRLMQEKIVNNETFLVLTTDGYLAWQRWIDEGHIVPVNDL